MAGLVELATPSVDAVPGEESEVGVVVRNTGAHHEFYDLEVVGPVAQWASVEPTVVRLPAGEARTVHLVLRPPRSAELPAGPMAFSVRLHARSAPGAEEEVEGTVDLLPFEAFTARLVPEVVEVRSRGRARIEVTNDGNIPIVVRLRTESPDDALGLKLDDETMLVPAATSASVPLTVRPRRRRLVGKGQPARYDVHLESLARVATLAGQARPSGSLPIVLLRSAVVALLLAGAAFAGRSCLASGQSGPARSKKGLPLVVRNAPAPVDIEAAAATGAEEPPPATAMPAAESAAAPPVDAGPVAPPAAAGAGVALRRFFDPALGDYIYTIEAREAANLLKDGLLEQGVAGRVLPTKVTGTVPLLRLKKTDGRHVFTADEAERRALVRGGAVAERTAGFLYPAAGPGTTPLYRMTLDGLPYLTSDAADVQARQANGWANEGVRGHVLT